MNFKEIEWTDDVIEDFYRYWGQHPQLYFSEVFGDTIVQFSRRKVGTLGRVLDFGSGCGGLLASLSRTGIKCSGLELGDDSRTKLKKRFESDPNVENIFDITTLSESNEVFNSIFLIETIEHLSDTHLEKTMAQIYSALEPGGWLIVSAPNKENLEAAKVYCPVSKVVFHPMHHVRSWSGDSLVRHLVSWQYVDVSFAEIDLNSLPYHSISAWIKDLIKRTLQRNYDPPHLFAFARKPFEVE